MRELRNIAEYAANICQGKVVELKDLPVYLFKPIEPSPTTPSELDSSTEQFEESIPAAVHSQPVNSMGGGWTDIEKEMILDALRKSGGNRSKAAKILGWGRTTLWRKLKKYKMA